jgi:iron complex transport system ATP-binding protein
MSVLEAKSISVRRNGRWILDDVTLKLVPGEVLAIVGPNGSGKSTLLRALAGIWNVSKGNVKLDGVPVSQLARRVVARTIAFVPQEQRTEFAFTVEEMVAMGRYPHRGRFTPETAHDRKVVENALKKCDIVHLRRRAVNTLSGGEHQRVLIARSLAVEPRFVLLDEPTANLDVEHTLQVLEICQSLASEGHAVALATHDLNSVVRFATCVVLLDGGRMTRCGERELVLTPENIERTFGVRTEVLSAAHGQPVYVFHSRSESQP